MKPEDIIWLYIGAPIFLSMVWLYFVLVPRIAAAIQRWLGL